MHAPHTENTTGEVILRPSCCGVTGLIAHCVTRVCVALYLTIALFLAVLFHLCGPTTIVIIT